MAKTAAVDPLCLDLARLARLLERADAAVLRGRAPVLNAPQLAILEALEGVDHSINSALCRQTGLDSAWLSRNTTLLRDRGWVTRLGESRKSKIALTDEGRAELRARRALRRAFWRQVWARLPARTRKLGPAVVAELATAITATFDVRLARARRAR